MTVDTDIDRVDSSQARYHFAAMLDAVLGGKSFIITRHGRDIAQLVPTEVAAHPIPAMSGQAKLRQHIQHQEEPMFGFGDADEGDHGAY